MDQSASLSPVNLSGNGTRMLYATILRRADTLGVIKKLHRNI